MKFFYSFSLAFLVSCGAPSKGPKADEPAESLAQRAERLAQEYIIVDGHVDVPYRLEGARKAGKPVDDISQRTESGDFDHPRAKAGGLDAPFMSIYVPAKFQEKGGAKAVADGLIDMVEGFAKNHPDKFALARTPDDIRANKQKGLVSLPMGIENGGALEGKLENVEHFYNRGVRYITLTHSKDNRICDSSYDKTRTHKGLSDFGKQVVAEMNRLGIMVDISHVSDDTFYEVLKLTKVPVIASHSSTRKYTPSWERNMSDDMIRALAKNGGVVMINFGSSFISEKVRQADEGRWDLAKKIMAEQNIEDWDDPRVETALKEYEKTHPRTYATVQDVADHYDHVVKLVGIDHVGFGSDFDGVGDSLPVGLKDASQYPSLIAELLKRGYSDEDIEKIASGNVFRVWNAVLEHAKSQPQARR